MYTPSLPLPKKRWAGGVMAIKKHTLVAEQDMVARGCQKQCNNDLRMRSDAFGEFIKINCNILEKYNTWAQPINNTQ